MLGHSSIVLTADTYTSVLPAIAHTAAEKVATLIIKAGCLVPGTRHCRRRQATRSRRRGRVRAGRHLRQPPVAQRSRAHAARQIGHPRSRHRKRALPPYPGNAFPWLLRARKPQRPMRRGS
jgi:hypothetical protein